MNSDDKDLACALQEIQRQMNGSAPGFEAIFGAAERQVQDSRRVRFAGMAAAAAIAVLAIALLPEEEVEYTYVDIEELTATTQWSAPSDSLFPEHQFDIYRELPRLYESTVLSTDIEEGALL